ncbi:hypothetical protein [Flavobacterium franklandianum]|uniref:Uncharacterized protein n=1 Tax=Flavobacterium franklandianum TaxID=2594430 RepID=A0A553C613_9FLAO|nr:hypothetical protein [Flavobacterium franklandianum]TRX15961.1 hypothetical protein FNW17_15495 [Flavobacterium franklandianum]
MITDLEFEKALTIIMSYQLQFDESLKKQINAKSKKININDNIGDSTFRVLQSYFLKEFNTELDRKDLLALDVTLLKLIDYDILKGYRGFGTSRLFNFKKLMVSHSIINKEEL